MKRYPRTAGMFIWAVLLAYLNPNPASGQGPTLPGESPAASRLGRSLLGPALGASETDAGNGPGGASDEPVSGRVGPSVPRVPAGATTPNQRPIGVPEREGIAAPTALP